MRSKIRSYSELIKIPTFKDRVEYLQLKNLVGVDTFGHDRYLNQEFYRSREWKQIKKEVIARDLGRDLAMEGYEIHHGILIHHMNVITIEDIENRSDMLLNPEYLITTTLSTHNAIHYGTEPINLEPVVRTPNDTCPWKTNIGG